MGTAAQFHGYISHAYNTDILIIFFPKESHGTGFLCFFNIHDICDNRNCFCNGFINQFFCFSNFFSGHSLEMREVKAQSACFHQRTCLFHVIAENLTKSCLKQMGCTVVLCRIAAVSRTYRCGYGFIHREHTLCNNTNMTDLAAF